MSRQQEILDRIATMSADVDAAMRRAREEAEARIDAERAQLQSECAAIGHVFAPESGFFGFAVTGKRYRRCAICGASESEAA